MCGAIVFIGRYSLDQHRRQQMPMQVLRGIGRVDEFVAPQAARRG
jgi:hypothetical protein